jgi:hypothetical protein
MPLLVKPASGVKSTQLLKKGSWPHCWWNCRQNSWHGWNQADLQLVPVANGMGRATVYGEPATLPCMFGSFNSMNTGMVIILYMSQYVFFYIKAKFRWGAFDARWLDIHIDYWLYRWQRALECTTRSTLQNARYLVDTRQHAPWDI